MVKKRSGVPLAASRHQNRLSAFLGNFFGASGEEMSEGYSQILDAAAVLRARGHTVEPDDMSERWLIDGGLGLTDAELVAMAVRGGLMEGPLRLQ
ncbi:hypothetical protein ACU4GR_13590 [Methylobacterium oryzae CBMB20]